MQESPGGSSKPAQPAGAGVPADEALPRAVIAGAVAALIGGGLWALVVIVTKYELGWIAWGVGLLVGLVMSRATPARGTTVAIVGAVIAALGLLCGKALIATFTVSARSVTSEIVADSSLVLQAASWHLDTEVGWPADIQTRIDELGDDTLPDALWQEMLVASAAHAASWTPADTAEIAAAYAETILGRVGAMDRLRWQFGPWDLLWFGLAVVTAFRILRGAPSPPETEAPAA